MSFFAAAVKKSEEILHGKVIDIAERPFQVGILHTGANKIICGGAIIKPQVVLTGIPKNYFF